MLTNRTTLAQFLIAGQREVPESTGELKSLLLDVALACKVVSRQVAQGSILATGSGDTTDQRDRRVPLEELATNAFLRAVEGSGHLAGLLGSGRNQLHLLTEGAPRGKYLLVFDPLDAAATFDDTVSVGSTFSVLRAKRPGVDAVEEDFLQSGDRQVAAGYALYGPATILVLSVGDGVHGFTLDPMIGEFFLTHPDLTIPADSNGFAINHANRRFWEPGVRRYVDECLAGASGPRGHNMAMRWVASLTAETHHILTRGGVFLSPHATTDGDGGASGLSMLGQANPLGMLIEQAGGRASTGRGPLLECEPGAGEQVGVVFGAVDEVLLVEKYQGEDYDEPEDLDLDLPLYASRGLFRPRFHQF